MLFDTIEDAHVYHTWYREQPWAELEDERQMFRIITVSTARGEVS